MSLMAHCDTARVDEATVKAIPEPAFTKTWHPVSHARVIAAMELAVESKGINIVARDYSLNKDGSKMFGSWDLDVGNGEIGYSIGIRNGIAKNLVLGVTGGTHVFICDNMCFSGDFIVFGKHTNGLDEDRLRIMADNALAGAVDQMNKMIEWQKSMRGIYVPQKDFKGLVFDMMQGGVFSPGNLKAYMGCLEEEKNITHPNCSLSGGTHLYAVHGAATRLMRGWNYLRLSDATKKLNGICDDYLVSRAA
jgi:hypothetical protein